MTQFKRHITKVYPIAGIQWRESIVSNEDGILVNQRRADTDTDRRLTDDRQYLIKWENFLQTIQDAIGAEANTAMNLGTGVGVFAQKDGVELQFRSLSPGAGIVLQQLGNEISISTDQVTQFQVLAEVQRPATPAQGQAFFNSDTNVVEVWTGLQWRIIQYQP